MLELTTEKYFTSDNLIFSRKMIAKNIATVKVIGFKYSDKSKIEFVSE